MSHHKFLLKIVIIFSFQTSIANAENIRYDQLMPRQNQGVVEEKESNTTLNRSLKITKIMVNGIPYHVIESNFGKLLILNGVELNEEGLESSICLRGNFSNADLISINSKSLYANVIKNFQVFAKLTNRTIAKKCNDPLDRANDNATSISIEKFLSNPDLEISLKFKGKKNSDTEIFNRNLGPNINLRKSF